MSADLTVVKDDYQTALTFMVNCHAHLGPDNRHEREFMTSNLRLYEYWGASFYIGYADDRPVTLVAARPGGRSKGPWGRYVNFYLTYTDILHRGKGYSHEAARVLRRRWRDDGQSRIKARASSWGGFKHFYRFGDQFWGLNEGDLVVDAALADLPFPPSIPVEARPYSSGQLSDRDLLPVLTSPEGKFRVSEDTARDWIGIWD